MHPEPHTCINMMVMGRYARTQKHRGTNQLRLLEAQFPTDVCHVQPGLQGGAQAGPRRGTHGTHITSHIPCCARCGWETHSFQPTQGTHSTLPPGRPTPWPHLALQVGGLRPACVVRVDDLHDV